LSPSDGLAEQAAELTIARNLRSLDALHLAAALLLPSDELLLCHDPGVLVSAIIAPVGPPAELLRAAREGRVDLVVSPRLLAELAGVLRREKFRAYLSLDDAIEYVEGLAVLAETVADPQDAPSVSRDPADDYLVALAGAAGATAIVSGDADLLALDAPPAPVLTPRMVLESLD
jgi:uncharacterized protein